MKMSKNWNSGNVSLITPSTSWPAHYLPRALGRHPLVHVHREGPVAHF